MTIFRDKTKAETEATKRNKKLKVEDKLWCVYTYGSAFVIEKERPERKQSTMTQEEAQMVLASLAAFALNRG